MEHLHQSIRTRTSTGKIQRCSKLKKKVLVFNCAKKLIFTFRLNPLYVTAVCRRQALYFWGLTAKLLMLDRYVNLAFFPTSKWNTSIGKSLKIEKYMIYNKEILWRTNSQKKKEKNPHKLSKYRSNCQNMVQKAWNTWVSRRYIFFILFEMIHHLCGC